MLHGLYVFMTLHLEILILNILATKLPDNQTSSPTILILTIYLNLMIFTSKKTKNFNNNLHSMTKKSITQ